jgi:hypothetical protein
MKLIDKIIYYFFWIHILGILLQFATLPIFITQPDLMKSIFFGEYKWLMESIMMPLALISTAFWIYCFWFYMKYDSRSNKWFALLFFNWIYAPIYYYDVKIKKRPLMGHDSDKKEPESSENEITEKEFIELNRQNVFGVIDLWSSKESQLDYQKNVPIAQVSAELFRQWEDFYFPDSTDFKQSFSKDELEILSDFDKAINDTADRTPDDLPYIDDFIKTKEWYDMNENAIEIKKRLNTVGNNVYNS